VERRAFLGAVTGSLLAVPLAAEEQQAGNLAQDRLARLDHPDPGQRYK